MHKNEDSSTLKIFQTVVFIPCNMLCLRDKPAALEAAPKKKPLPAKKSKPPAGGGGAKVKKKPGGGGGSRGAKKSRLDVDEIIRVSCEVWRLLLLLVLKVLRFSRSW